MKKFVLTLMLTFAALGAWAQRMSVSTNLLSYANLGTLNAEFSFAMSRRWTGIASVKYNPFSFGKEEKEFRFRQRSVFAGAEYWPWHVYSGWWFRLQAGCQEYNQGGFFDRATVEGYRFGLLAASGYSYMISSHLNVAFGLAFWSGMDKFRRYSCQQCGLTTDSGNKFFLLPGDAIIAFSFVF